MFSKVSKYALVLVAIYKSILGDCHTMDTAPVIDIAIIGGGLAGLTAAYKLNNSGSTISVFEAKNRFGGRTNTHYFTGTSKYYEEGGTTIDSDHTHIYTLAKDLKVPLDKVGYADNKITVFANGKYFSPSDFIKVLEESQKVFNPIITDSRPFHETCCNWTGKAYIYKSIAEVINQLSPLAQSFWRNYIKDESGIDIKNAPISFCTWLNKSAEEYQSLIEKREHPLIPNVAINLVAYSYRVQGGLTRLVTALQKSCTNTKFHPEHILISISKHHDGYQLIFMAGQEKKTVIAKKVIMTIPFSTLRDVHLDESLMLSKEQLEAIHILPYGTNSKIGVPISGNLDMLFHLDLDQEVDVWPGHEAITIMVGGENGRTLNSEKAQHIVDTEKGDLKTQYTKIGDFGDIAFKNWFEDPYAKGSYSTKTTDVNVLIWNSSTKYPSIRAFAEPSSDHSFIFAGEHTRDDFPAYMEGAVRSGEFAADIILGKDFSK